MTAERPRTPWVQTTTGAIVIDGVIVAVISTVVTWIINNAATLPWVWILATFAIVAVAVFLILSLVRKSLRDAIWARPAAFLWSLRPVSYRTLDRLAESLRDDAGVIARDEARTAAEKLLATQSSAPIGDEDEVSSLPPLPPPKPRWALSTRRASKAGSLIFKIENRIPESVALNARIDSGGGGWVSIEGAAFWRDLTGPAEEEFEGRITSTDVDGDAKLTLTYLDDYRVERSVVFWVRDPDKIPDPPAPVWSTDDVPF